MKDKIYYSLFLLLAVFSGWTFYRTTDLPRVAYVRSADLVYKYNGMIEAQQDYRKKTEAWQANVDTLRSDFQREIMAYNRDFEKLSPSERKEREKDLSARQQSLQQYAQSIEAKKKEEDDRITQGVLNQINSFVESYGKSHGYDIIFGTTNSGNLLYGENYLDITQDVLAAMNSGVTVKSDTLASK